MMKRFSLLMTQKHSGQSLMMVAMIMTILMVGAVGYSLVQMNGINTEATMTYKQETQSYLLAKAGLDEALATRLIPRSNQLNFAMNLNPNGALDQARNGSLQDNQVSLFAVGPYNPLPNYNPRIHPFYRQSGVVMSNLNPNAANNRMMGYYRYLVLGGDPARKAVDGSYFNVNIPQDFNRSVPPRAPYNQLFENEFFRLESTPFVVVSNGFTCQLPDGLLVPPNPVANLNQPTCPRGSVADQTTLVTPVNIEMMDPNRLNADGTRVTLQDQMGETRVFKNEPFQMPANLNGQNMRIFVPGRGLLNSGALINFQNAWQTQDQVSSKLNAIVFFNSATKALVGRPIVFCDATCPQGFGGNPIFVNANQNRVAVGAAQGVSNVPPNTSIKLFFDGPIDYRSPYNYQINGTNAVGDHCATNKQMCKIHLSSGGLNPTQLNLRDFNVLSLFPSNTQVLISPTYEPDDNNRLIISGMRDYAGNVDGVDQNNPRTYDLRFFVTN